ncbi:MAG: hypothetical protein ACTSWW_11405, partial [Promethearchaeota archaeon]
MGSTTEIIIIYLDLATKILSKKEIIKTIDQFVKEKQKRITQCTFSAFYFKEDDSPYLTEEVTEPKELLDQIQREWKKRETTKSQFENGLFYCLSFLAAKAAKKAANYRVIVISDTPSTKNAEYAQALMGLVETVRTFPTFIDILRIGENDMYPDDVKLRIISTITSGGVFYATNSKEFKSTLLGLAKNKTLPDLRTEGGQEIEADQKAYYENLAKELFDLEDADQGECMICSKPVCDYCQDPTDLRKCPNCGGILH